MAASPQPSALLQEYASGSDERRRLLQSLLEFESGVSQLAECYRDLEARPDPQVLADAQAEIRDLRDRLALAMGEAADGKAAAAAAVETANQLTAETEGLRRRLLEANETVLATRFQVMELEASVRTREEAVDALTVHFDEIQDERWADCETWQARITGLETHLRLSIHEVEGLKGQMRLATAEAGRRSEEHEEATKALTQQLADEVAQRMKAEGSLAAAELRASVAEAETKAIATTWATAKREIETHRREHDQDEARLLKAELEAVAFAEQRDAEVALRAAAEARTVEAEQLADSLRTEKEYVALQLAAEGSLRQTAMGETEEAERRAEAARAEARTLADQLDTEKSARRAAERAVAVAQLREEDTAVKAQVLTQNLDHEKERLREADGHIKETERRLNGLQAELEAVGERLRKEEALREKAEGNAVEAAWRATAEAQGLRERLRDETARREMAERDAGEAVRKAAAELQAAHDTAEGLDANLQQHIAQIQCLQRELEADRGRVTELQASLQDAEVIRKERDDLKRRAAESEARLADVARVMAGLPLAVHPRAGAGAGAGAAAEEDTPPPKRTRRSPEPAPADRSEQGPPPPTPTPLTPVFPPLIPPPPSHPPLIPAPAIPTTPSAQLTPIPEPTPLIPPTPIPLPPIPSPPSPPVPPLVVAVSGFRNSSNPVLAEYSAKDKKVTEREIEDLGGRVATSSGDDLDPSVTHVVTAPGSRTIKCLAAVLMGRWVVTVRWVHDSHAVGHWLEEGPYGYRGDRDVIRGKRVFLTALFRTQSTRMRDRRAHTHALVETYGRGHLVDHLEGSDIVFITIHEDPTSFAPRRAYTWEQFIEYIYPVLAPAPPVQPAPPPIDVPSSSSSSSH